MLIEFYVSVYIYCMTKIAAYFCMNHYLFGFVVSNLEGTMSLGVGIAIRMSTVVQMMIAIRTAKSASVERTYTVKN